MVNRPDYHHILHREDVPADVIGHDDATAVPVPGHMYSACLTPGVTSEYVKEIDVPVFIGLGERDCSPDPHREPSTYASSRDVTLFFLPQSGHCDNFATRRRLLWDRVVRWNPTVA